MRKTINEKRNIEIARLRKSGEKIPAIAGKFGISKQRVEQIIRDYEFNHGEYLGRWSEKTAKRFVEIEVRKYVGITK